MSNTSLLWAALSKSNQARDMAKGGQFRAALDNLKDVLVIRVAELEETNRDIAITCIDIGNTLCTRKESVQDYQAAVEWYIAAKEIYEKNFGPNCLLAFEVLLKIGDAVRTIGDYREALIQYGMAAAILENLRYTSNTWMAEVRKGEALTFSAMRDYNLAVVSILKAIDICKNGSDKNPNKTFDVYQVAGQIQLQRRYAAEANFYFQKALSVAKESFLPNDTRFARIYNDLADAMAEMGDFMKADEWRRKAT